MPESPFLPIYHSQTIGYSDIAENGLKLGNVTKAGLFYWEIQRAEVIEDPSNHYEKGKVWVPFMPKPLEFEVDFTFLDPLLKEAKKLWKTASPPSGRDGCKDCVKAQALFALGSIIDEVEQVKDQRALQLFGNLPDVACQISQRIYDRRWAGRAALLELHEEGDRFNFADAGMMANWESFDGEV